MSAKLESIVTVRVTPNVQAELEAWAQTVHNTSEIYRRVLAAGMKALRPRVAAALDKGEPLPQD